MNVTSTESRAKLRRCLAESRRELDRIEQAGDADAAEELAAAIADRLIELSWLRKRPSVSKAPPDSGLISTDLAARLASGEWRRES